MNVDCSSSLHGTCVCKLAICQDAHLGLSDVSITLFTFEINYFAIQITGNCDLVLTQAIATIQFSTGI